MTPIVNRLEQEFSGQVAFRYLDAADGGVGQSIFESLKLPGHPGFLIFSPDGGEQYRAFGIVGVDTLRAALRASLGKPAQTAQP